MDVTPNRSEGSPPAFIGRQRDAQALTSAITAATASVLILLGERGIGKTTLASRVFDAHQRELAAGRFSAFARAVAFRSGEWRVPIEDWLLSRVAAQLAVAVIPNATRDEL